MADKIRLGLIGASVKGTWSARSHLPAVAANAMRTTSALVSPHQAGVNLWRFLFHQATTPLKAMPST